MMVSRKYKSWLGRAFLLAAFLLAGCSDATKDAPRDVDGRLDSFEKFIAVGKGDVPNTIHENSPEARAILEVANTYSLHKMVADVELYWLTSHHVVTYRKGPDELPNTSDDRVFMSLAELDEVYYVGPSALRRFRKHVQENDLIEYDQGVSEVVPEAIQTSGTLFRSEIFAGEVIDLPLEAEAGDRVLMWFRKADEPAWNPKITVYDAATGSTIAWANPWGTADARLPRSNDDLEHGFEFDGEDVEYAIKLENTSDVDGVFEFVIECVGGPCSDDASPGGEQDPAEEEGVLRDEELRAKLVSEHERNHMFLSYDAARLYMFSWVDNVDGSVECVYTGMTVETEEIPDHYVMNAEHTWPQSKGAVDGSARTDLHHLYPVLSNVNSLRANYPFCEVEVVVRDMDGAMLGYDSNGERCFEPRASHKGNVARSIFYFATVYQQTVEDSEENVLRSWAVQDPIDATEKARNGNIEVVQGTRNPFIDHPEYIERIADF